MPEGRPDIDRSFAPSPGPAAQASVAVATSAPACHLNASRLADCAVALGAEKGFGVEVFDEDTLPELGGGGVLGVNAGSSERPAAA
jgi:leucyl aminopeptidase